MICPQCRRETPGEQDRCVHCQADTRITGDVTGGFETVAMSPGETGGHSSSSAPIFEAGAMVAGRYKILRTLGEGGMGAVYQAEDQELNRLVALKVIRPELASRTEILNRFKREVILTQEVSHRNVVRLYDLAVSDGLKFITMEFIDGEDLQAWRKRQKLTSAQVASIMIQVCRGLEAAHAAGVVHRDLKPQNIMLDRSGRAAVMDFGIAHSLEDGGMTRTGVIMGTPHYMSPEQALGQKIDQRSDLYSLGIIIYELLADQLPFHSDTILGTLLVRTQQTAPVLMDVIPGIPAELSHVVARCLERDPANRYQGAGEIVEDLRRFESGLGVAPVPLRETMRSSTTAWSASAGSAATIPPRSGQTIAGTLTPPDTPAMVTNAGTMTMPPVAPPAPATPVAAKPTRRWILPASGLAAVALAGGGGYYFWGAKEPGARSDGRVLKILVADFTNNTAEAVFDRTMEPMLVIALEAAPFVTSVNRDQARRMAAGMKPNAPFEEELARLVAVREGYDVVIGGSIDRQGSGYAVTVTATDARDGKQIGRHNAEVANKNSLLASVEKLGKPLRRDLGAADSEAVSQAVGETFTTSTLEAVKAYSQAQEQAYAGNYEKASGLYRQTIQLDPDFGRAYAGLGVVYRNLGDQAESERYFQAAFERLNRMTDREKLRTQGAYFLSKGDNDQAIETYSELTRKYPADTAGHANLSVAYLRVRNTEAALRQGKKAIEIYPGNVGQINNVASYAICAGKFDEGRQFADRARKLNPNYAKAHMTTALAALLLGEPAKGAAAYRELEKIAAPGPALAVQGLSDLAIVEGRFSEAVTMLEQSMAAEKDASPASLSVRQTLLAIALVAAGQFAPALVPLDKAAAVVRDQGQLALIGHLYARAKAPAKATALAAKLAGGDTKQAKAYAALLRAEAALATNDPAAAITLFRESAQLLDTWLAHLGLGRCYLQKQQGIEATAEFIKCENRRGEAAWLIVEDVPTYGLYPGALYDSARARESSGDRAGAKQAYEQYLKYRAQATDPMTAMARERFKSL